MKIKILYELFALILIFTHIGCGKRNCPESYSGPYPVPNSIPTPQIAMVTSFGINLSYPIWLKDRETRFSELLDALAFTKPEKDSRISESIMGAPAGTNIVCLDPGPYYAEYSPTKLAAGEYRPDTNTIYLPVELTDSVVPAYGHELRHLYTGDPNAGH